MELLLVYKRLMNLLANRQHEQQLVAGSTVLVVPCGMRTASVVNNEERTVGAGSARPENEERLTRNEPVVTMFAFVLYTCSSGRVVPPLAARRSPTDEIKK